MRVNYQPVNDGHWSFLLEENYSETRVLVLVSELQGEAQMVDSMIDITAATVPEITFYRLNTYPEHTILQELPILILPAVIIFKNGTITYISDKPLTRGLIMEKLA